MPRVAAIAIDAAEWWYLERLLDAGRLPNLARLRARSAEARIASPPTYRSESVWTRFLTGQEPLDRPEYPALLGYDPGSYGLSMHVAPADPPFFAFGPGTKVIAIDLINSRPDAGVDGPQLISWGSHSPQWPRQSLPVGLMTEMDERFGTNPSFENDFDYGWHQPDFLQGVVAADKAGARVRTDIGLHLLAENPDWELLLVCISEFHSIGHHAWHGVDELHPLHGQATSDLAGACQDEVTEAIDHEIGRLLDALPADTNVMVFAMHGMQPGDDTLALILAPELVHRHYTGRSFLRDPDQRAWRKAGCPAIVPKPHHNIGSMLTDSFASSPKQRLRRATRGALGYETFDRLRRVAGKPVVAPLTTVRPTPPEVRDATDEVLARFERGPYYQVASWYQRSWPSMPAFVLPGFADGHVRVNVRGRERDGIVDPADFKRVCDDVVEELRRTTDARTGQPVLADVHYVRNGDPFDPNAIVDDLLLFFDGAPDAIEHPEIGTIGPFPHLRTGAHSSNGFCLVSGPGIERQDLGVRPAIDLTATVLRLMGRSADGVAGDPMIRTP